MKTKSMKTKSMKAFQLVLRGTKARISHIQVYHYPGHKRALSILDMDGNCQLLPVNFKVAELLESLGFGSEG